jgi:hypothetical protein
MSAAGGLPPYGYLRIPLPGGARYVALGPGGPVTTRQQVAGIVQGVRRRVEEMRASGIEVTPQEERQRINERMAAIGGTLSQRQYDRLREQVFTPRRDTSHPRWAIARSADPNTIALWLSTLPNEARVWLVGFGAFHRQTDVLSMDRKSTGYLTLGEPGRKIQYAETAREAGQLRDLLDPNALQQFWAIDEYTLRWLV